MSAASVENERVVLASALLSEKALSEVMAVASLDDFAIQDHRTIYGSILQSANEGPVAITTVGMRVPHLMGTISRMTDGVVPAAIKSHLKRLKEDAKRRRLIAACQAAIGLAEGNSDTSECVQSLSEALLSIQSESHNTEPEHCRVAISEAMADLQEKSKNDGLIGIPTGIPSLDSATTGPRAGELWVVGALPGRGKTSLGEQLAISAAQSKYPVLVFSHEMTRAELATRALATKALSASALRNPRFIRDADWQILWDAAGQLSELPIWIDDSPSLRVSELTAKARLHCRRHQTKLVVVDYLQLVAGVGKDLRERVGSIAGSLRELAKTERVAVLLLSQLRRPDGGINERPTMVYLKESGDIEAHAHTVLLLYMPVSQDGSFTGEDEIIIGKQRHGRVGSLPVHYDTKRLQFKDRT